MGKRIHITLENLHLHNHRMVNRFFQHGGAVRVVAFAGTGQVYLYQDNRTLKARSGMPDEVVVRLPDTEEKPGMLMYLELHFRYANLPLYLVDYSRRSKGVPYSILRTIQERVNDHSLAPIAFWPSSKYTPEKRVRDQNGVRGYKAYRHPLYL